MFGLSDHLLRFFFSDPFDSQFLGFVAFGAGVFGGDDKWGLLYLVRVFRKLSAAPDSYDPERFFFDPIEETVRTDNDFAEGKVRKLRQCSSRLWKLSESGQTLFRFAPEINRRLRILAVDKSHRCKELFAPRRSEKNFQGFVSVSKESASARTSSSSYPLPASISFSPQARRRKISNSCWECL